MEYIFMVESQLCDENSEVYKKAETIKAGDVITMQACCKHTVVAETELHMIEVQLGENISSRDKHKYEFDFAP